VIVCPSCGERTTPVPIVYGMPGPEDMAATLAAADGGELVIGGCVMTGDDPQYACPACREPVATTVAVQPGQGEPPDGR
jgi:hypothetical protein